MSPPPKAKWYYVVAQGRVPGVYTDWGQAKWQFNGYSGVVHKKFQDQREYTKKFMRDNRDPEDEESEGGGTESSGTKASRSESEGNGHG